MSIPQPLTTTSAYPDRSTRLLILGAFQVLLGCLCGLFALMMLMVAVSGQAPGAQPQPRQAMNMQTAFPGIFYLLLAVAFIWVGVGLARARRWAWTLTVVLSWMWLIMGLFSMVAFTFFMGPETWAAIAQQGKMPPEAVMAMRITAGAFLTCTYILLPGVFVIFCNHQSVRATCQRRDPKVPWTDRCPMPVLALSIIHAFAFASMFSVVPYGCVMPIFGVFLSGAAGAVVLLLIELVLAYLAWGTYRLQMAAWWGTLLLWIAGTVNMVVTFARTDLMEMYQKMGMPADQLEMIRKSGVVEAMNRGAPWIGLVVGAAWAAYLIYVRRYFLHGREGATRPS